MLTTPREITAALDALRDATGCDLADLAAVVNLDPHAVRVVLELFVAAVVAIIEGAPDHAVRARIGAVLDQLAVIRTRAASQRWAA